MIDHKIAFELLDEYLTGTLLDSDYINVQEHIDSGCEICLEYINQHGDVSVFLAEQVPMKTPSSKVRENLLNQIKSQSIETTVTPIPQKKPEIWSRTLATIGIAASIVLLFWMNSIKDELSDLKTELDSTQKEMIRLVEGSSLESDVRNLLSYTCTKVMELTGVEPNENSFAQLVMHPEETYGIAYVYRMPPSPAGTEYQLWVEIDNKPVSVGVFKIGDDGQTAIKLKDLPDPIAIKKFQVTIEPEGGTPEPTGMLYLTGDNILKKMDMH